MTNRPVAARTKRDRVTKHTTMRLPPDVMRDLGKIAAEQERSRTWVVEKILRDYLSRQPAELASVFE